MRETRPSGSEGGARFNPLSLPLSCASDATDNSRMHWITDCTQQKDCIVDPHDG